MTDESIMPYGIHKGKEMADVPLEYLLWLYENQKCFGEVKKYIQENIDVIKGQIAYAKKKGARR
ncbi:MAG: DUF3820 family protein [Bacteroidales bacterium]|nr:DUF3820 family protein [Bacteroidales bacterium]